MINIGTKFVGIGGVDTFPVYRSDASGFMTLGYIERVFDDVYYVTHEGDPNRDITRYRTWPAALSALTGEKEG